MKFDMKRLTYSILISAGLLGAASCSFLDMKPNVIASETFYNSRKEVLYGLAGVYGVMNNEEFYGNYYSIMLSNTDDLSYYNRPSTTNFTPWYKHDASAAEIYRAWTEIYSGISNANAFMEAVAESEFDADHKLYNEARFLRAYYHFILAQAWGDVPLKTKSTKTPEEVMCPATSQYEVLKWAASEMEACLELADESLENTPSRVAKTTIEGVLARVYLFMAGETVQGNENDRNELYRKAMESAKTVISSGLHRLNPDYTQVFINMISDKYDTEYRESMWEVDFMGNRSSAENWSNGRIGDILGLQSSGSSGYADFKCNYSYGQYDGSLQLWDLYWKTDRTDDENEGSTITDKRQEWNMCPYNYAGNANYPPYPAATGSGTGKSVASIDKTPYVYNSVSTSQDPTAAPAIRNCGKFRREVQYEGVQDAKRLYTQINYPLLRYSDVLLMYAEASNEYSGPSEEAYDCVKQVRDRAGIATKPYSGNYDSKEAFRQMIRNERGRELCFESLRKYDLIRWGVFENAMHGYVEKTADERWTKHAKAGYAAAIGAAVQHKHIVLPIPAVELGVNKELHQNPLW